MNKIYRWFKAEPNKGTLKEHVLPELTEIQVAQIISASHWDYINSMQKEAGRAVASYSLNYELGRLNWSSFRNIVKAAQFYGSSVELLEGEGLIERVFTVRGKPAEIIAIAATFARELWQWGELTSFESLRKQGIKPSILQRFKEDNSEFNVESENHNLKI